MTVGLKFEDKFNDAKQSLDVAKADIKKTDNLLRSLNSTIEEDDKPTHNYYVDRKNMDEDRRIKMAKQDIKKMILKSHQSMSPERIR